MKLAIVGKAASGKDYLRKRMIDRGMKFGVSTTTRPPREGEIDGVDYHFVERHTFEVHIETGSMLLYQEFNGHYYGITQEEFNRCNCLILNVDVIQKMSPEVRRSVFVIYLNIDIKTRMERMKERDVTLTDIAERVYADDKQYYGFTNYDLMITNPNF